ncbi:OsmC family peroxiredoxin [Hymenobacter latericus]|uniref:OsmC family peroxiredoxin n=1 Tax=Hymenobacter sp. YIM 151858-1 TaxID=2987688 RepID=UPI0022264D99|nr:OsmC family peroxiredoxin [Hymenobacter sp. YIM 151858-1]UYZ59768.1 OsmC family peroxiredoxin [Hymenobacter sp. YIM 151858-1]
MAIKRAATARWEGNGTTGTGQLNTPSTVLQAVQYSYHSRFAEGIGTNPEELIAAAHAGCFAMKLAFNLQTAGFAPRFIDATCEIVLEEGVITTSHLRVGADVPGLDQQQFSTLVDDAKLNCPVSKVLKADIQCEASLV